MSGGNTPSPTGSGVGHNEEKSDHSGSHSPVGKDIYTTESETHTPSKEEIETNEKNLMHNTSYLGQLIFKLRLVTIKTVFFFY